MKLGRRQTLDRDVSSPDGSLSGHWLLFPIVHSSILARKNPATFSLGEKEKKNTVLQHQPARENVLVHNDKRDSLSPNDNFCQRTLFFLSPSTEFTVPKLKKIEIRLTSRLSDLKTIGYTLDYGFHGNLWASVITVKLFVCITIYTAFCVYGATQCSCSIVHGDVIWSSLFSLYIKCV